MRRADEMPWRATPWTIRPRDPEAQSEKETAMQIQPYLFFDGRTEEALDFYKKTLGAKVDMLMRFKENPEPQHNPPNSAEKVMHATFRVGDTQVMASDGMCGGQTKFEGFALSVAAKSEAEADKIFGALAEGGQVQMPMAKTFFSPRFGMVADRFGVSWMVIVAH
jgi:PhnB protein